jgi:hypothetical protein
VLRKDKHVLLQKIKQQAYSSKGPLLREDPMTIVRLSHVNNNVVFSQKIVAINFN